MLKRLLRNLEFLLRIPYKERLSEEYVNHSEEMSYWGVNLLLRASQVVLVVKNPPANTGDGRDTGSIPGSGRSPGGGHGNPLQYSCLENPMDRGTWKATVHGVAKSWTRLKRLSTHALVAE